LALALKFTKNGFKGIVSEDFDDIFMIYRIGTGSVDVGQVPLHILFLNFDVFLVKSVKL
jgi:hypothetical protein